MTRQEAQALCGELHALVPEYPGANQDSLRQAERIAFRLRADPGATPYLREKLVGVLSSLEIWCSARKWQRYQSPDQVRGFLMNDLGRLEMAIDRAYPDEKLG